MLFESRVQMESRFVEKDENGMSRSPDLLSPSRLADALLPVALAAGRVQMGYFRAGATVRF